MQDNTDEPGDEALGSLAGLLIEAKDLADDEQDATLQSLVNQALFRIGTLIGRRLRAESKHDER